MTFIMSLHKNIPWLESLQARQWRTEPELPAGHRPCGGEVVSRPEDQPSSIPGRPRPRPRVSRLSRKLIQTLDFWKLEWHHILINAGLRALRVWLFSPQSSVPRENPYTVYCTVTYKLRGNYLSWVNLGFIRQFFLSQLMFISIVLPSYSQHYTLTPWKKDHKNSFSLRNKKLRLNNPIQSQWWRLRNRKKEANCWRSRSRSWSTSFRMRSSEAIPTSLRGRLHPSWL